MVQVRSGHTKPVKVVRLNRKRTKHTVTFYCFHIFDFTVFDLKSMKRSHTVGNKRLSAHVSLVLSTVLLP